MKQKICIVIVGPTAVGKTHHAIEVAQHLNTQIISADSRQCYKELNIGVAKPSHEELQKVHHYFIDSHSVHDVVNAKVFEQYALEKLDEIFKHNDVAVMAGGTGMYIKAFWEGIDEIPDADEAVRKNIISNYEQHGIEWLQQQIQQHDPLYYSQGEIKNPQRLMRALEVKLSTGRSITTFQSNEKVERDFKIIKVGLQLPKEELIKNINQRVDIMMQTGLLEEVRALIPLQQLNALQTVGYRELFDYFNNILSLQEAIERIKINTRQYAKRQMTWFKKDEEIYWMNSDQPSKNIIEYLQPKI